MAKKEGPLAEQFMTHFYETWAIYLFKPLLDIPDYKAEQPTSMSLFFQKSGVGPANKPCSKINKRIHFASSESC